jgi:hypothetical protein
MNYSLAQIILAQNDDGQGWMNILFIVVLAVIWAIGGIIKAKTKKAEGEEEKEEQFARKPHRKLKEAAERFQREVSELSRDRFYKPRERAEALHKESFQKAPRHAVPAARKEYRPVAKPKRSKIARPVETLAEPELPRRTPQVEPDFEELPEFTSKAVKELQVNRVDMAAEIVQIKHLSEILSDYADPEELRRAILHYEILGRPLSLRDPSGHIIGLQTPANI